MLFCGVLDVQGLKVAMDVKGLIHLMGLIERAGFSLLNICINMWDVKFPIS